MTGDIDGSRGQTLPDFAVGIAVFLFTVAFVFAFVPQLILPFEDREQSVVAERIGSDLGNDLLVAEGASSQLEESSTTAFFDGDEEEALGQLGIEPWYSLNVTLRNASSLDQSSVILCEAEGEEWIVVDENCDGSDRFAIGDPPPRDDGSPATVRRTIPAGDRDVVLEVSIW